jgi:hypothetical protein
VGFGVKGQTFLYFNLQPLFDWKESFYRIGKYLIEYISIKIRKCIFFCQRIQFESVKKKTIASVDFIYAHNCYSIVEN